MTPVEFKRCLQSLDWTMGGLAGYLGLDKNKTTRWGKGETRIPENVAAWLTKLSETIDLQPYPEGWEPEYPTSSEMRAMRDKARKARK